MQTRTITIQVMSKLKLSSSIHIGGLDAAIASITVSPCVSVLDAVTNKEVRITIIEVLWCRKDIPDVIQT